MTPRKAGIDLFRIAGIQIAIDYSWLAIFAVVWGSLALGYFPAQYPGHAAAPYWIVALAAALLFFSSVLLHELSHSLVANALGQDVRRITLFIFGGMAHLTREPRDARTELLVAVAGPLMSLLLAGLFWLVEIGVGTTDAGPLGRAVFHYLAIVNLALALFNLLPGLPLDGGRLLRGVLWMRSGNLRAATARAANWGAGIALGIMALGALQLFAGNLIGGLWFIFIGMFLRSSAQAGYHGVVVEQVLNHSAARDLMVREPIVVPAEITVERALEEYFLRTGFGGFPVRENGQITGIVSLAEVKRCPREERSRRSVREIMRRVDDAIKVAEDTPVSQALRQMVEADTTRLLVSEGDRIAGLLTKTGILRFVQLKTELASES